MNFISRTLAAAAVTVSFSLPAFAQYPPASSAAVSGLPNQTAWDKMLSKHPKAAAQLSTNPNLIYQPAWQASHPDFRTFFQTHPADWRALKANGSQYYDGKFNSFLGHHPNLAAQLQADPSLVYNPAFRRNHPALNNYLASHPNVWGSLRRQNVAPTTTAGAAAAAGGAGQAWGAYDQNRTWRDANWWHQHNVDWARQNHPEWWQANGPYYGHPGDGDWDDEHHEWHDRWWWHHHRPDWVQRHHPDWWYAHKEAIAENHREHEEWKHRNWEEKHLREWHGHHGHGR